MSGANINFQSLAKGVIRFAAQSLANQHSQKSIVSHIPGNISQRPFSNKAGLFKLFFVCSTSLYIGGLIAHKGASFLEENEIFVPAEEDDDD